MITPIFVLDSPRSGTTVIGEYIGSADAVFNTTEYTGFYFTELIAPELLATIPSPIKDQYIESLRSHAYEFISDQTRKRSRNISTFQTPNHKPKSVNKSVISL
ncbi:hypothetical protein [Salinispira pacifica]|uniref:hypothetical protein n=1 Tax=Salinispira pacifica TaxID=1307761 RepID=UPI00059E870C|nr:hypothetical protein [Salinispira pacifica]